MLEQSWILSRNFARSCSFVFCLVYQNSASVTKRGWKGEPVDGGPEAVLLWKTDLHSLDTPPKLKLQSLVFCSSQTNEEIKKSFLKIILQRNYNYFFTKSFFTFVLGFNGREIGNSQQHPTVTYLVPIPH